jgi:hypothetical protein
MQEYWSRQMVSLGMGGPGHHCIDQVSIGFYTLNDDGRSGTLRQSDHELKAVAPRMGFLDVPHKCGVNLDDIHLQP